MILILMIIQVIMTIPTTKFMMVVITANDKVLCFSHSDFMLTDTRVMDVKSNPTVLSAHLIPFCNMPF